MTSIQIILDFGEFSWACFGWICMSSCNSWKYNTSYADEFFDILNLWIFKIDSWKVPLFARGNTEKLLVDIFFPSIDIFCSILSCSFGLKLTLFIDSTDTLLQKGVVHKHVCIRSSPYETSSRVQLGFGRIGFFEVPSWILEGCIQSLTIARSLQNIRINMYYSLNERISMKDVFVL